MIQKNKFLGVVIDNSLYWKEHIKSVSAKVSCSVASLTSVAGMTRYVRASQS